MIPETNYARLGDIHLAYQVLGEGPPDILMLDQWFSHMEAQWDVLPLASFRERLATFGRLIMFDKRGAGLSDPVPMSSLPTLEQWMDDASTVLDAAGSERAVLIANLGGGLLGTTYAAAHPERVASLVLVDCFARYLVADDYPFGGPPDGVELATDEVEAGAGHGLMLDLFAPSFSDDEPVRRAWTRYERQAASPGMMKAVVRLMYQSDVRSVLSAIRVPTLVIHHAGAERFGPPFGRFLAEHIEGEHNHVIRRQLERFGGREIKTVGDGVLATFDGPARAVRCAAAIRDGVAELGLQVRAGLHTGEIELEGDDIAGLAVHIGARVSALASGGEILVSSTVKDLVAGSGLTFEDRGSHELKGVPGEWRLFRVVI